MTKRKLNKILKEHKLYLYGVKNKGKLANLRGCDLKNFDLRKVDLRGAYLENVDFRGADLRGAKFTGSYLLGAKFDNTNLTGSDIVNKKYRSILAKNRDLSFLQEKL